MWVCMQAVSLGTGSLHLGLVVQEDGHADHGGAEHKGQGELKAKERDGHQRRHEHGHAGGVDLDNVVGKLHDHGDGEAGERVVEDHDEGDPVVAGEEAVGEDGLVVIREDGDHVEEDAEGVEVQVLHVDAALRPLLDDHLGVHARGTAQHRHHQRQDHARGRRAQHAVRAVVHLRDGAAQRQQHQRAPLNAVQPLLQEDAVQHAGGDDVQVLQDLVRWCVHIKKDKVLHQVLHQVQQRRHGIYPELLPGGADFVVVVDAHCAPDAYQGAEGDHALGDLHHAVGGGHTVVEVPRALGQRNQEALGAGEDRQGDRHDRFPHHIVRALH
mmetsp:Transcript_4228/g.10895  ORF Transcript_4228/g.10895 Transcript_4228/m.10895 type:complete len:326 (+) Transcript_4228:212-1189(+)